MGDLTIYNPRIDGPDERPRQKLYELLERDAKPVYAPAGAMTVETFREHNQNNAHLAVNVPAEIASDPNAPPAARLKAAEMISVNAYGKAPEVQVNVGVVMPPSESDDEIIARYIAKYGAPK